MNENINNGRGILLQTLYIFGNGFDIAHGIRTPYAAFREFLKENHESFLTTFESMYNIQPLDDTEPWYTKEAQERWDKSVINDLWWSFEEKIGHPDVEGMYDSAYSMVDTTPMEGIIDTMNVYWREQYGFVDKLQKYVLEWLQTIDTSKAMCKKDSLINNRNDLFMSFNYTDTLEKVYGIKDVLHLHGGIPSCCEIAPIMGHGNKYIIDSYLRKAKEAQEEYVEWYESICTAIADFCESLYKDTDAIISENDDFFSALRDVNQVVCLGLSFGDVDVPYLDRIEYEVRPETKWLVYYHSDEDLKRLKSVFGITGISRKFEVYRYMVKGNLNHLVHEFYYVDDGDEARHSHNEYEGCILIFEDEKEHQRFKIYVRKNWDRKDEFVNDIWIPHMEQLPGYNMDAFREEYLNVQILRRMLQEFRNNGNTKN